MYLRNPSENNELWNKGVAVADVKYEVSKSTKLYKQCKNPTILMSVVDKSNVVPVQRSHELIKAV